MVNRTVFITRGSLAGCLAAASLCFRIDAVLEFSRTAPSWVMRLAFRVCCPNQAAIMPGPRKDPAPYENAATAQANPERMCHFSIRSPGIPDRGHRNKCSPVLGNRPSNYGVTGPGRDVGRRHRQSCRTWRNELEVLFPPFSMLIREQKGRMIVITRISGFAPLSRL
jgi:hypothetical protein